MSNSVNLALDVTKTGIQNPLIKVRQGDGGFETLRTTVTANGEPMDLQGWTITFMGTTAGNHKIVDGNVTLVEAPNGIFDYTPSKAWGMDIGEFKIAYFKFVKGDGSASSANFRVNVIEAVDITQEEAKNYISVVDTTIAEINQHLTDSLAHVTQSISGANSNANTVASNVNTLGNRVDEYNNKLAAIQVGGRNLLIDTSRSFTGVGNGSVNGNFDAQGGVYLLAGGKRVSDFYKQHGPSGYLTLSFDWVASGSNISGKFSPQWNAYPWGGGLSTVNPSNTNTNGHYEYTLPLTTNGYSSSLATGIQFRQDNLQGNITISNMKLEGGNIATDWTPAPEDAPSNDAQLVHKTGTETVVGDKTFTGNTSFSGGVTGGQVNLPASGDLNALTDTGKYYQSQNGNVINWTNRPSNAPNMAFSVDVIGQTDHSLVTQVYYVHTTSRMWLRTMWLESSMKSSAWAELANDNNVVHRTGNESIAGDKTFTGVTNIQNQKQYKASFTIGANTINLTRIGSIVYVNARTKEKINGSASYGVVPAGFAPANSAIINFIVNNTQGSCLFQANLNNVWFPEDAPFDSNMSGSYLTSDALPS